MATILEKKKCCACGAEVLFDPKGDLEVTFEPVSVAILTPSSPWSRSLPPMVYVGVAGSKEGVRLHVMQRIYLEHVCPL